MTVTRMEIEAIEAGAHRVVEDVRCSSALEADLQGVRQEEDDFVVEVVLDGTTVSWTLPGSGVDEAAVFVADGMQYEVETRTREPWPRCGGLPRHSLRPRLVSGSAEWVCQDDNIAIEIGRLGAAERP